MYKALLSPFPSDRHRRQPYISKEGKPSISLNISRSISICTYQSDGPTSPIHNYTYRTEAYLQQREKQTIQNSPTGSLTTTWKNVTQQRRILENEQAEIDRALSTIDSIHGSFNRSLLKPFNQVYSSLYGDDDKSARLMKIFCQRQDHCTNYDISRHDDVDDDDDDDDDDNESNTQEMSSSCENFSDTDFDNYTPDEEEKENEKKKSYDSGFGSVLPIRQLPRKSLLKMTQVFSKA